MYRPSESSPVLRTLRGKTHLDLHLIGGCGSSGTTLLAHILHGLRDIRTGPEMGLFHHRSLYEAEGFRQNLYRLLAGQGARVGMAVDKLDLPLVPSVFFMDREYYGVHGIDDEYAMFEAAQDLPSLLRWVKGRMALQQGIQEPFVWLDQTPKNAIAAKEFLDNFPGSTFIHLVRDGRDVMLSLARRYAQEAPGHSESTYLTVGMARWAYDTTQALRARHLPGYMEVRYEDLVSNPLRSVNAILARFGRAPVQQGDLDAAVARSPSAAFTGGAKPTWGMHPGQAISSRSVGRWRTALSAGFVEKVKAFHYTLAVDLPNGESTPTVYHFGQQLQRLGYR